MKIFLALFLAMPVSLFGQGTIFSSITRTNALTSTNLFLTSTPVPGGTRTIYFSDLITSLATNGGVITDVIASDALKFSKLGDSAANAYITNYLDRAIRTLTTTTPTLDLSLEGQQYLTLSGNTTVTIANAPSGAKQRTVFLNVLGDTTRTIAFAGVTVNWLSAQHSPPPATWIKYRFEWNGSELQGAVEAPLLGSELPIGAGTNTVITTTNGVIYINNASTGGSGTPGGSDTHVQFNDGSAFGGEAGFVYNKTTDSATLVGTLIVADEVYDATTWNGNNAVPTKNAVRDKIETISVPAGTSPETMPIRDELFSASGLSTTVAAGPLGLLKIISGSAANTSLATATPTNASILQLTTGTTAAGYCQVLTDASIFCFGTIGFTNQFKFRILNLPDTVDGAIYRLGFGDSTTGATPTDSVNFRYSTNNTQLICVTRANNVETSVTNTTVIVANQWYVGKIVVSPTASSATFTVDGADSVVITSNIPSGITRATGLQYSVTKDVGTTAAKVLQLDWVLVDYPR